MMKKIERAAYFLKENMQLFRCPVCQRNFIDIQNNQIICSNNHAFNLSKKGTVYFLNSASVDQYDKELFESRKIISDNGFWDPIVEVIQTHIPNNTESILDVGCGNGSNLSRFKKVFPTADCVGFDISKQGIEMAAKNYSDIFWCVADLANTPFANDSFDVILNIFTPSNYKEFMRLLKSEGRVIKVVPNPDYLKELRSLKDNNHSYSNDDIIKHFKKNFNDVKMQNISYNKIVPKHLIHDLLNMTPLGWQIDKNKREELISDYNHLGITIDVTLLIGR